MRGYYIDPQGRYYEGDRAHALDTEVPQRPDATYDWDGTQWVENADRLKEANNAPIFQQIEAIEAKQARAVRELALDATNAVAKAKLQGYEADIVALRAQLQ